MKDFSVCVPLVIASRCQECLLVILGLVESLYRTSVVIVWVKRRAYLVYFND